MFLKRWIKEFIATRGVWDLDVKPCKEASVRVLATFELLLLLVRLVVVILDRAL